MNISGIISGYSREIANEALYFCIRALKQAGLPVDSKKDPFHDTETSKPSENALALAKRILTEIVSIEKKDLDYISAQRIKLYIDLVADASYKLVKSNTATDIKNGTILLQRMRKSYP
ncbi:MAG: hypothetical protein ACOYOE_10690 [Chlorobium sp.]